VSKACDSHSWRGLTLLELLVVITLLGLVAATVTSRIGNSLDQAAMGQAKAQWAFTDAQLRQKARRSGREVALHLEVGTNRLECAFDPEHHTDRTIRTLARGVTLSRYLSATHEVTHGPLTIHYSEQGTTETFAVELTGQGSIRRWLLMSGLTGQVSEIADETQVRQLLELLLPQRLHAG
jgi:prepilin-type N-terminal cleavage/methylation domain-containing protein